MLVREGMLEIGWGSGSVRWGHLWVRGKASKSALKSEVRWAVRAAMSEHRMVLPKAKSALMSEVRWAVRVAMSEHRMVFQMTESASEWGHRLEPLSVRPASVSGNSLTGRPWRRWAALRARG